MKAIIEIPKGDTRRRHLKYDKSGFIDLGAIRDVIPVNDGVMPVHYGYIPNTENPKEKDEIDAIVLSDRNTEVGQEIEVRLIALLRRADGDDKIVAVDDANKYIARWTDISEDNRKVVTDFFSYHHKILSIENADAAREYVENNYI